MVLVTGSKGLIGSHLCKALYAAGVDFEGVDITDCDLTDRLSVWEKLPKAQVIIHTAAMAHIPDIKADPFHAINTNIQSTINLLEYAIGTDVKHFIFLSSCSVYGDTSSYTFFDADESFALKPKGVYGVTKACGEMIAVACQREKSLPVTILRLSSVYGEGDKHGRVIPNFINAAIKGDIITVNSTVTKEFTYVGDVVSAILLCLDNPKAIGETFNIHGGEAISIDALAHCIKRISPNVQIIHKKGEQREQTDRGNISIKKAKDLLGYEPKVSLGEGLKRVMAWALNSKT